MKRNIEKYVKDYLVHSFENIMDLYRPKKLLEYCSKYLLKNILQNGAEIYVSCKVKK